MSNLISRCHVSGLIALSMVSVQLSVQAQTPSLQVQTATGQTTFHIGERIPLILAFTVSGPDSHRYQVSSRSYDRSGRLSVDHFDVSPSSGWSDPLEAYFSHGSFMGGGLFSIPPLLSSQPFLLPLDLNEWVRFDEAGVYAVTITTDRVAEVRKESGPRPEVPLTLRSNTIRLHIVPATPEWQAARLTAIVSVLDEKAHPFAAISPERKDAVADLRYLASTQAIRELTARLQADDSSNSSSQYMFGLLGLPPRLRDAAIAAMNERIDQKDFPISPLFLSALLALSADPHASPREAAMQSPAIADSIWHTILAAALRKEGNAKAQTVQSLVDFGHTDRMPETQALLGSLLAASFANLPEQSQTIDLLWHWDLLDSQAILPVLQTLAKLPLSNPGSNDSNSYNRRELKSAALRRWIELDPDAAQREIFAEVGSSDPSLPGQALAFLPKQPLPQFESVWSQALMQANDSEKATVLASLLARFGSGASVRQVEAALDEKEARWSCAAQAAALAYLVRFDTDTARPRLKQAFALRDAGSGCRRASFQEVATYASGPALNEAAIEALASKDNQFLQGALTYLTDYGEPSAKQPVLNMYRTWTERWSASQLDSHDSDSMSNQWEDIGVGTNLARALIAGHGWFADGELISTVIQRCVGEQMCRSVKQMADSAIPPYKILLVGAGASSTFFQVAQYMEKSLDLLDAKIGQFPRGTKFVLVENATPGPDKKSLESEVELLFKKHEMSLVKQ